MQNFGGANKEYYGIFESGLLQISLHNCILHACIRIELKAVITVINGFDT